MAVGNALEVTAAGEIASQARGMVSVALTRQVLRRCSNNGK